MEGSEGFLIIGISGTTNGGKTTLVKKLKSLYPYAETICQDKYFLDPNDERLQPYIIPELNHVNWEQFGAMDMDRMIADVEYWKDRHYSIINDHGSDPLPILIIEGFLIFNHSILNKYFHKKYFLFIDKETCLQRRRHRCYNPPDIPGYFEKVVWPMYLVNKKEMDSQTDIVYLDGAQDQEVIVGAVASDINELINQHPAYK